MLPTLLMLLSLLPADSGLVRVHEPIGRWQITVLTDPTPLRAGPIDIAFLIQTADDARAILDATIELRLLHVESGLTLSTDATRAASDNRLLYAAKFTLPESGTWHVESSVTAEGDTARCDWSFEAGNPLTPWSQAWPWILPAPIAVLLYAANQRLRHASHA